MVQCPSCARRSEPCLVCPQCGGPLPAETDGFTALGLPPKLVIDLDELERAYHTISRRIHPDHFVASPPDVRAASLKGTALLTRSYRILRDSISRGIYWLELKGDKLSESNNRVPAELAELVFEVQEQLAELRASRDQSGDQSKGLAANMLHVRQDLDIAMNRALDELNGNFRRWDSGAASEASLRGELKAVLARIAYLRTLIRDVDRELETVEAA